MFYNNFVRKMNRFWDIRLVIIKWPWNPCYGSLKVIGTDMYRFATYDFLLTFHSNHGPISYRFRDIQRFRSKIAKFPQPHFILRPCWRLLLGIGYWHWGVKKLEWCGYRADKKFDDIFSRLDKMHERDRQTDGQTDERTDTGPQQRPRLRIASRGNKMS